MPSDRVDPLSDCPKEPEDRHPWLARYHRALDEGASMSEAIQRANNEPE